MKSATKTLLSSLLASAAIVTMASLPTAAAAGQPVGPNATPFGIEISVAPCSVARTKLGAVTEKKLGDSDVLLTAKNPSNLYDGANEVIVRCQSNQVVAVQFEASKGGMGSESSREVYSGLSRKYKLVAGGPMPQLGNGYARFASGNTIIEQSAPHLSFEFTVTYYAKDFYESIVAENQAKTQKTRNDKQATL